MEESKVFLFIYIVRCHFQETFENREPRYHMTKKYKKPVGKIHDALNHPQHNFGRS